MLHIFPEASFGFLVSGVIWYHWYLYLFLIYGKFDILRYEMNL